MARRGEVQALMKGSLHPTETDGRSGVRRRRLAHRAAHRPLFVMDVPAYPRMLLITDAAVNVVPNVRDKADIVRNAIDLAQVLGIDTRRGWPSWRRWRPNQPRHAGTVDAAMLCKMADRGQISGGLLDGPLAFDNAINEAAAHISKNIPRRRWPAAPTSCSPPTWRPAT